MQSGIGRLLLAGGLALSPCVLPAQDAGSLLMVRATLVKTLDTTRVKTGDVFYLKTTEDWQRPDCTVHTQSVVAAEVTRLDRPGKGMELALRFQAMPCAGDERLLLTPLLVALGAKPVEPSLGLQRLMAAPMEGTALSNLFNPAPPPSAGLPPPPPPRTIANGMFSWSGRGADDQFHTGDVRGFRNVKMRLPEGSPETTLSAAKSLYLESGTVFVLTMVVGVAGRDSPGTRRLLEAQMAAARKPDQVPAGAAARKLEPAEVCAAGGCVEAVAQAPGTGSALWSRPLENFGFVPRLNRVVLGLGQGLDDDAVVEFLGEDQVLLAFNTHKLVRRTAAEAGEGRKPRLIRALVFARSNGRLLKAEDWTVENDAGPFAWSLGDGRVLAHVGNDLVVLGEDLEATERFPLPGPLLFLSPAMGKGPSLLATVKERHVAGGHTAAAHEQLARFLRPGELIDEDYELTALDGSLHRIGSEVVRSEPLKPALLADAMVSARPDNTGVRYSVQEQQWTGEQKRLATVGSGCDVQVETLAAKVLYVSGCDPINRSHGWYRLVTPAGATLLKGTGGSTDLLQQALVDQSGLRFLTVSTNFNASTAASLNVLEGDFKRMTVSVFNVRTGKELFRAVPAGGSAMRQPVALSPSGAWMAVLSGSALQIYSLGAVTAP